MQKNDAICNFILYFTIMQKNDAICDDVHSLCCYNYKLKYKQYFLYLALQLRTTQFFNDLIYQCIDYKLRSH